MCDVGADGRALFSLQLPGADWVLLLLLSSFLGAQSCPILCDPMNCSTLGFPVLHHLLQFAQIHVH